MERGSATAIEPAGANLRFRVTDSRPEADPATNGSNPATGRGEATTSHDRPSTVARLAAVLATVAVGLWGLRWLPGRPALAPGADVTGHLQRIEAAWALFGQGHTDGWFDGAMLGYQAHLFYGPGLALATGAVRVATLGTVSTAGALLVVSVAAYLAAAGAVARLARALGLAWWSAAAAGMLSLACSSPRGGGLLGGFETALAAQQLAVPLVVMAMALTVETLAAPRRPGPAPLALTVTALALTHPLSLVMLGLLGPLVVAAAMGAGRIEPSRLGRLAVVGAAAVALSTYWWWPALTHRDLRGPATSWDLPGWADHLEMAVDGTRGLGGPLGPITALGVVTGLVVGVLHRRRDLVALAALPLGALAVLHLAHGALGLDDPLGMQIPNRGLVYAALLAMPATARVLEELTPRGGATLLALTAGVTLVAVTGLVPAESSTQRPTVGLREAAAVLDREVPAGGRFAYLAGSTSVGVPAPERWLAWASGRPGLAPFGPEYAPGAGVAMGAVSRPPEGTSPDDAAVGDLLERVRMLAVTHVVVADPAWEFALARSPQVDLVGPGRPSVWALVAAPGAPVGSVVPADRAEVLDYRPGDQVIEVTISRRHPDARLALGWSPGWRAWIDDVEVRPHRSADGRLGLDLPPGEHRIRLSFEPPPPAGAARIISAVALAVLAAYEWARRRGGDSASSAGIDRAEIGDGT